MCVHRASRFIVHLSHSDALIQTCETDNPFPKEAQEAADRIFGDAKTYKRNYYAGCSHGFAVRADLKDPVAKKAKEEAFKECYEWFVKHL